MLKSSDEVEQAVTSWEQLTRYLALQLSLVLAKPVSIHLTRLQAKDPESRIKSHIDELVGPHSLTDYIEIPNAAGNLKVTADFSRRALDFSMMVASPKNRTSPSRPSNAAGFSNRGDANGAIRSNVRMSRPPLPRPV